MEALYRRAVLCEPGSLLQAPVLMLQFGEPFFNCRKSHVDIDHVGLLLLFDSGRTNSIAFLPNSRERGGECVQLKQHTAPSLGAVS